MAGIVLNENGAYMLLEKATTFAEARKVYQKLKARKYRADTLERHYFRAKQRLLLGEVMHEDVISMYAIK